ncbi:MAG: BatD family protein [Candidatus Babeliales bacterium]|nr:BatD family protein [Candidatus Babeliales bacterium]
MGKIIGKLFFVIALALSAFTVDAQVTLKAYDMQGDAVDTIGMGQSFTLEVAVDGFSSLSNRPIIKGLEKLYVRESGTMSTTINGKSTVKYTYKTRIDTQGVYSIGPATIVENNQTFASNAITIKVVEPSIISARLDKKNGQSNIAFLRFKTDKNKVVQGEKIVCILRFYYTSDVVNIQPIVHTEVSGLHFDTNATNNQGRETVNGVEYQYFDFIWDTQALEVGKKVIPAYSMDFSVRLQNAQNSPWAMFFGHAAIEQKRVYSNAVSIEVDPLPPYKGTVHAIGTFNSFTAKIEPAVAKEGQGMLLSLEIDGDGVFDKKNGTITLSGVPDSLKFYESKEYKQTKNNPNEVTKNCFEFVVQGLEKGDKTIPRQSFTFFDVVSRSYKTLHTLPLSVMILSGDKKPKQFGASQHPDGTAISIDVDNDAIAPISRVRPVMMAGGIQYMPWWLFFILVGVAVVILLSDTLARLRDQMLAYFFKKTDKKNAFKIARLNIAKASQDNQYVKFSSIFITLFATRSDVDKQYVDESFMRERLASCGMSDAERMQWDVYFSQLIELVFFNKKISIDEGRQLTQAANHWIDRLQELL